mmetsp:Transcript_7348/g.26806  ORF Transcript_7348/g.26806 Transcript_7348/m.26806 type:complete len:201 (-) Transcript_7348:96-698(-)
MRRYAASSGGHKIRQPFRRVRRAHEGVSFPREDDLPLQDRCQLHALNQGAHFGVTPDSSGAAVYHYHVQDMPPFTFGCFGPKQTSTGVYKMLTVAECRALYDGCGNGDNVTLTTPTGSKQYDPWCPCWDADGSNVGTKELAVFSGDAITYTCTGSSCTASSSNTGMASGSTRVQGSAQGLTALTLAGVLLSMASLSPACA